MINTSSSNRKSFREESNGNTQSYESIVFEKCLITFSNKFIYSKFLSKTGKPGIPTYCNIET